MEKIDLSELLEEHDKETKNKTIDDFMEEAMKQFIDFELNHGYYPTVADCKVILRDIAEQMKQ